MRTRLAELPPRDRVMRYVTVEEASGCWTWNLYRNRDGYGKVGSSTDRRRSLLAHRWSYELLVGPIPSGLTIDHLCRNRACVNPDHLEPVTQRENNARSNSMTAMQARQVECIAGHDFSPANTYVTTKGERKCRARHYCGFGSPLRPARSSRRSARNSRSASRMRSVKP